MSVHAEQASTIHLHRVVNMVLPAPLLSRHCMQLCHSRTDLMPVQIKDLGAKAGVVLNPGTSIDTIEYVLDIVDLILIMSGGRFLPSASIPAKGAAPSGLRVGSVRDCSVQ